MSEQSTGGIDWSDCANCGEPINTTPGMDCYTEITDYSTTDYSTEVYCNRLCLEQSLDTVNNQSGGSE